MLRPSRAVRSTFVGAAGLFCAGLLVSLFDFDAGWRVTGVGLLVLAVWLVRNDLARRTLRQSGLTRFIAACLLAGYFWLGIAGVLAVIEGGLFAGPRYDVLLHALFLGFVISMIFGHAPMILPGVMKIEIPYRTGFYGHLGLLHISLLIRVIGDLIGWVPLRQWGGAFNVIALLLFLFNTARAAREAAVSSSVRRGDPAVGG